MWLAFYWTRIGLGRFGPGWKRTQVRPRSVPQDWLGISPNPMDLIGLFSILVRTGIAVHFGLARNGFGPDSDFSFLILAQNQSPPPHVWNEIPQPAKRDAPVPDATRDCSRKRPAVREAKARRREVLAWRREVMAWRHEATATATATVTATFSLVFRSLPLFSPPTLGRETPAVAIGIRSDLHRSPPAASSMALLGAAGSSCGAAAVGRWPSVLIRLRLLHGVATSMAWRLPSPPLHHLGGRSRVGGGGGGGSKAGGSEAADPGLRRPLHPLCTTPAAQWSLPARILAELDAGA
jgi:hypothetical protein